MERRALAHLFRWYREPPGRRKPLILRGARQVGKSFLVRDFCRRQGIRCLELNFEKQPGLRQLFVEGDNLHTIRNIEAAFQVRLDETLLFLDEIQAAPEVFARLRYFYEDSPSLPVAAAGSLLEFALAEADISIPVGRVEYLYLGPMTFEEFLLAQGQSGLLQILESWSPFAKETHLSLQALHSRLLGLARDFAIIGGMPEAVDRFGASRDFLSAIDTQRAILDAYIDDFKKYRKRIPVERLELVFRAIPRNIGSKWVHARINPSEQARATEAALNALCKAQVAHRITHSSGDGVPLEAQRKDERFKVLFLDVGLASQIQRLQLTDVLQPENLERVDRGQLTEQWVGQELLAVRPFNLAPKLHYWVREKAGSQAEVDYLISHGAQVLPVEIKAGSSARAKSLAVFLMEKKAPLGIHFSTALPEFDRKSKILRLPIYLASQIGRILDLLGVEQYVRY